MQGLSSDECQLDLAAQMAAGTETSITIVRGILLLLVTSPTVYMKSKQEIAKAVSDGRVSSPVTNAPATTLPYMQALLLEGTRMMPPLTLGFPKRVPAGGDTVCDTFLPAGTDVYQNFGAMLRNPDLASTWMSSAPNVSSRLAPPTPWRACARPSTCALAMVASAA